ncbi:hypothetical protein B0H19DRAFT_1250606 [Mycena capillaripes]|nr:hypothetical protein B0H19DRAFT_1250606 [Mycena capillaripes]
MLLITVAAALFSTVASASALRASVCSEILYSVPQCCSTDVLGITEPARMSVAKPSAAPSPSEAWESFVGIPDA